MGVKQQLFHVLQLEFVLALVLFQSTRHYKEVSLSFFFFFFFFALFWAPPPAYGGSRARVLNETVANSR